MGQYQQWLHYRELDQHLRGTLTTLEDELAHVQAQAQTLQHTESFASNAIIQALLKQHAEMLLAEVAAKLEDTSQYIAPLVPSVIPVSSEPAPAVPTQKSVPIEVPFASVKPHIIMPDNSDTSDETGSVSPALFAWSMLPIFNPQELQTPPNPIPTPRTTRPTSPNLQEHLLPEDMNAFSAQHHLINPQQRIAGIPNVRPPQTPVTQPQPPRPTTNSETSPVDQQSVRTDRLVERWFERWNRHSKDTTENQERQQS